MIFTPTVFRRKIAEKALASLSHCSGDALPFHKGTAESLLKQALSGGADGAVVLNIATNPRQQASVNNFAIETNNRFPNLFAFGSIHPEARTPLMSLCESTRQAPGGETPSGLSAFLCGRGADAAIYEKIASLGLITVFHAGVDIGYPDPVHCTPERLAYILPAFGNAPVVAAMADICAGRMCSVFSRGKRSILIPPSLSPACRRIGAGNHPHARHRKKFCWAATCLERYRP